MAKHVTILVSNDLEFDQRVSKTCNTLLEQGFRITLVGRMLSSSSPIQRSYSTRRFNLLFSKGVLFYAAFNLRLFFYLLFARTDVILANDLDTLLPAFLISKMRNKKLVYDSHEYFTEAEGLTGRSFQKKVWLSIEGFIFPRLKHVYTVNQSIATIYSEQYGVAVKVVRNIPPLQDLISATREDLNLPLDKKLIILQGAYIDPDRGAKEALEAMEFIDNALLIIIGSGREMPLLKEMAKQEKYLHLVKIFPKMPFLELRKYTMCSDLGLTLDKPLHLNYKYSLPNKLFDYIHCGIPVLGSNLPETSRIIHQYQIGWMVDEVEPSQIASKINKIFSSDFEYQEKVAHCKSAALELNWQNEASVIKEIFSTLN